MSKGVIDAGNRKKYFHREIEAFHRTICIFFFNFPQYMQPLRVADDSVEQRKTNSRQIFIFTASMNCRGT